MRHLMTFLSACCLSLATTFVTAEMIGPIEYSLAGTGKNWKLDTELDHQIPGHVTQTYILDNETKEQASETFGTHMSKKQEGYVFNFHEVFPMTRESFIPGKVVDFRLISTDAISNTAGDPKSLLVEWEFKGTDATNNAHGWTRVFNTDQNVVILQYETKKLDQVDQARKNILPVLENAHLVEKPAEIAS
jgi:hypothetical protein